MIHECDGEIKRKWVIYLKDFYSVFPMLKQMDIGPMDVGGALLIACYVKDIN